MNFGLYWLHQHSGLSWNHSSPKERWAAMANLRFQVDILFWFLILSKSHGSCHLFFLPAFPSGSFFPIPTPSLVTCRCVGMRSFIVMCWKQGLKNRIEQKHSCFPEADLCCPSLLSVTFLPHRSGPRAVMRRLFGQRGACGLGRHPEWASCSAVYLLPACLAGSSWTELEDLEKLI